MKTARTRGSTLPRFDWMQATIRDDVVEISDTLADSLGGVILPGRGLNGYRASNVIKRNDETLARVLYGGNGNPHVIATGAATDDVVPVLRGAWAGMHEVTRMDSAQDFDQVGAYDRLRAIMLDLAASAGLTHSRMESTVNGILSRTTYLGSPTSRVRVRLYEKGCMEAQRGDSAASQNWVRMEAQIRPTGQDARSMAAALDPTSAWGLSSWTQQLARRAFGADVERVNMRVKREPDFMRAMRAMSTQYGATIDTALEQLGSLEALHELIDSLRV